MQQNLNVKTPNILNLGCLVTQTAVAFRRRQCNNTCFHIHSTGIFLCWQSQFPELRSQFRSPQLRPEGSLHLTQLCSFHSSFPSFLSPSKGSTIRVSCGKQQRKKMVECRVSLSDLDTSFIKFGILLKPLLAQCCHGNC